MHYRTLGYDDIASEWEEMNKEARRAMLEDMRGEFDDDFLDEMLNKDE